ncbi:MAG: DNRLRE domain-containing protein, partial [Planctomycetota bacterium]
MLRRLSLALIATTLVSATALADVVNIPADKDNTLYENASGALSNGAGEHFFAGRADTSNPEPLRRGLIEFDIDGAIPAGSTINSVTLTLVMSRTRGGIEPVSLHRVLADWGEAGSVAAGQEGGGGAAQTGDATWLHTSFSTTFWTSPGGDFSPTASATQNVGGNGSYSWSSAGMVADVQAWLDGTLDNHGWLLLGNESTNKTAKRFESRENGTTGNRPVLVVDF